MDGKRLSDTAMSTGSAVSEKKQDAPKAKGKKA